MESCSTSALNVGFHLNHRYYDQDPHSGRLDPDPRLSFDAMSPSEDGTRAPAIGLPLHVGDSPEFRELYCRRRTICGRDPIVIHLRNK